MTTTIFATVLTITYSIIILWRVTMLAREGEPFTTLAPIFLWGILYNALGAFIYYQMLFTFWWFVLDFLFFACYLWLLVVILSLIKKQP